MSRRALRERERAQSQAAEPSDMTPPATFVSVPPPSAPSQAMPSQPMPSQPVPSQPTPPLQAMPSPTEQQQTGPAPSYRVRDYSPDARGSQFSTVGGTPPGDPTHDGPTHDGVAPVHPTMPVAERVLTRRELRELRDAEERAANPEPPQVAESAQFVPPQPERGAAPSPPPELIEPLEPHPQEFAAPQPLPYQQPQSLFDAPAPDSSAREPEPAPDVVLVAPEAYAPPAPEFELAPDYAVPVAQPFAAASAASAAVPPLPPASVAELAEQHAGFARPEGHWSRQADLDARTQIDDVSPSRDLSQSDAITTSALVLPSMPAHPIGALSSTGEILVTGSIDLPRMLGATGVHPARFDHADFDSIIEAGDREDSHPSSAPVRAIRAVSTHTSTQGIIAAKRPRSKVPTYVLAGVATVMGVGVVVLFVGGMLLDLF